ncbi:MAG TPA: hypothetical protein VD767_09580 [Thermomicrobiales bacterium]|nr:hypothetical protein [Thermomicrobiales bacterium]
MAGTVSVQAGVVAEGFTLPANSAYCEPGYLGPFVGCTSWEGLEVTFESDDGSFSDSCVTAGSDPVAGCSVVVPFGSTITASINPDDIPDRYVLQQETSQVIEIPDGPPEGEFGGAVFVLFAEEGDDGEDDDNGGEVAELPDTGTGIAVGSARSLTNVAGGLATIAVMLAAGAVGLRRRTQ